MFMTIARGEPLLASDINNLTFFPKGTILMYDGDGWVDNQTIVGWYACTATNAGRGCPNLVDRFIKGSAVATHAAGGNSGNGVTIGANNLPAHTHNISNITTGGMSAHDSGWFHVIRDGQGMNADGSTFVNSGGNYSGYSWLHDSDGRTWWSRYNMNIAHTHTLSGHTDNNATTAAKLNIEPQSYALIYIRKCV
jgi:hypothetical protein